MLTIIQIFKHTNKNLKNKYLKAVLLTCMYMAVIYVFSIINNLIIGSYNMFSFHYNSNPSVWRTLAGLGFSIFTYVIDIPLIFSYITNLMDLYRNNEFSYKNLYTYFIANFKKSWCIFGRNLQKILLPIILLFVAYFVLIIGVMVAIVTSLQLHTGGNISEIVSNVIFICKISIIISVIIMIISLIVLFIKELSYVLVYFVAYDNPDMTALQVVNESARIMRGNRLSYFALALIYFMASFISILASFGIGLIFLMPYMYFITMVFYDGLTARIKEN